MKRLLLLLLVVCMSTTLSAQIHDIGPRHEVRLGMGVFPPNLYFDYYDFDAASHHFGGELYDGNHYNKTKLNYGVITESPSINLSYTYRVAPWCELGGVFTYQGCFQPTFDGQSGKRVGGQRLNTFYLSSTVRFVWVRRDLVRMYSGLGFGLVRMDAMVDRALGRGTGGISSEFTTLSVGELTLVGITVGRQLFGFAEVGVASRGYFTMGIGYRMFTPKQRGHERK